MDSSSTSHQLLCKDSWLKPISLDWVHSESDYPSQHGSDERSTRKMLERGTESSIDLLQGLVAFLFWFRICWSDILEQNWKQSPSAGLAVADQLGQSEARRKKTRRALISVSENSATCIQEASCRLESIFALKYFSPALQVHYDDFQPWQIGNLQKIHYLQGENFSTTSLNGTNYPPNIVPSMALPTKRFLGMNFHRAVEMMKM